MDEPPQRDYVYMMCTDHHGFNMGLQMLFVHSPDLCRGQACCIHHPSEHHMRQWPQLWRADRRFIERICPHGTGHPDPDDLSADTIHGCDGCCLPPEGRVVAVVG